MKRIFALVAMVFVTVAGISVASAQSSNKYLTGHVFSSSLNIDLTIDAYRAADGTVRGHTTVQNSFVSVVTEVVAPLSLIDYWCINSLVEGMPGYNWIWFVKDQLSGDQITSANGLGLTCAGVGTPVLPFEPITTGDFVGEVVGDTCAGDLATCNASLATVQAQVTTLTGQLSTCQSDLAALEGGCNLPQLSAIIASQLTGGVNLTPPLSGIIAGKVQISAKKVSGVVSGTVKLPDKTKTTVIDLVPPHDCINYWCIKDAGGLWFVTDVGTGCDLVSYRAGAGLSCTDTPSDPFDSALPGNFTGKTRGINSKTCPE